MRKNNAKIVSMVPSWTETLLECELNVVGRTRFCIYPLDKVSKIQIVGGTKQLNIEDILRLKPDYVILDREENKLEMAEALLNQNIQIIDSHVTSVFSACDFLDRLSKLLNSNELSEMSLAYRKVSQNKESLSKEKFFKNSITRKNSEIDESRLDYAIWKNPFMLVGADTFINDVFSLFDLQFNLALSSGEKYPVITSSELLKSYVLFSTEPYDFEKKFDELTALGFKGALIDGEKLSWYGIRNFNFLRACLR